MVVLFGLLTEHDLAGANGWLPDMELLLDVRNLSVRYRPQGGGEVFALRGANLTISAGEIVGVVGESGSGKSTLASSMIALLPSNGVMDEGAVVLQGTNLLKLGRGELERVRGSRVSLIFQEPGAALHPTMRVGAQIEEVLRAHGEARKEERRHAVRALLDSVFAGDAERIYFSYPHQLSGGQRQRIAIAQAIACNPKLLIADEPTASLDAVTRREIIELLKKLRRERELAILFITHSVELLEGFADRVVVMYAGRMIEEGDARSVLNAPRHPYTEALLECRPTLGRGDEVRNDARIPVIAGEAPDLSVHSNACAFEPRCAERMKICGERVPEFYESGNGGRVRCFKFGG
ncbi:MAG TPA: ABC transporter ATP-binding protein [Candidatus Acidoferrum sp.]|nr:ABC transporter ATP-binding protein [Candidatus Acidoferrum sp.]